MKSLKALLLLCLLSKAAMAGAFVACIDPGHPSETSSGANEHGISENRINWQVAVRLKKHLRAAGIACVMTKQSEKQYVTNRRRAEIANHAGAGIFLRLHCDSGSGRGYTFYYPDRAGHKGGVTGPPAAVRRDSRLAASVINGAMPAVLHGYLRSNPIKTDAATFVGGKQGGVLTGSIFSLVPTALIEMCDLRQRSDARFIASADGQERMAAALTAGIISWKHYLEQRR